MKAHTLSEFEKALERCDREIAIAITQLNADERWVLGYYDWHAERRMILAEIEKTKELNTKMEQQVQTVKALELADVFKLKTTDAATGTITDVGASYQRDALNAFAELCHAANKNWWLDLDNACSGCGGHGGNCGLCLGAGYPHKGRNVGELLMLCVSELAEALEGHRKNLLDDKLPHRKMFEVELADLLIRVFDLCGGMKLDIGGAFVEKQEFNKERADHKVANRKLQGGKAY